LLYGTIWFSKTSNVTYINVGSNRGPDNFGHLTGDPLLTKISQRTSERLRDTLGIEKIKRRTD